MSDLLGGNGGRPSNNGARSSRGPVPVSSASSQQSSRPGVIPPTEIMRRRREKAAAEASAEELRIQQDIPTGSSRPTGLAAQPQTRLPAATQQSQPGHRRTQSSTAGRTSADPQYIPPYSSRPAQQNPPPVAGGVPLSQPRSRATTQASGQPRPPPPTAGPSGTQQRPSRQSSGPAGPANPVEDARLPGGGGASSGARAGVRTGGHSASASQGTTASTFPHAFERWETLSSHWEGLTSYWIHRLEQNNEELIREPMLVQLSRQVTDLSAAGANLFHAVVELQRLRASSERKFQRWFFETRKEAERQQEITAQMEAALVSERQARANDSQRWEAQVEQARRTEANAQKLLSEMRRELQISKEEARRAWEELGRREQQERERTMALNQGQAIDVGGFIVYPKQFQTGTQGSTSQRPVTRDGPSQYTQDEYGYEATASPSNTDPFTESGPLPETYRDTTTQSGASYPYPAGSANATSGSTTGTVIPSSSAQPRAQASYTSAATRPSSSSQQESSQATMGEQSTASGFYHHPDSHIEPGSTPPVSTEGGSYVQTDEYGSEHEEEGYEMDESGQIVRDAQGNPVPWRRGLHPVRSEESDEYDVAEDARREQQLAQQYGTSSSVTYPAVPAPSSTQTQQQYASATAGPSRIPQPKITAPSVPSSQPAADYTGAGFGPNWDVTHHHPSRLSDVIEMDEEERQSRVSERSGRSQGARFGGSIGAPF